MHISILLYSLKKQYIALVVLYCFATSLFGQSLNSIHENTNTQHVFLLGNLEEVAANSPVFLELKNIIGGEVGDKTLLFNGDFIDEEGIGKTLTETEKAKINGLLQLANSANQSVFVPGDREWDNGGKSGLKKVQALQAFFNEKNQDDIHIAPENGCLGPEVIDIGTNLRIVAINTQWWVHRFKRPVEEDLDCPSYNETEFWDELEDAIQDSDNRNVIIAAHHPILSYGQSAGYALGKTHFLPPVIGSFIAAYHLSVGGKKDLAQEKFQVFAKEFIKRLERYAPVIYTSGHEYDLQINQLDNSYHLNSGNIQKSQATAKGKYTQFRQSKRGFTHLSFFKNGLVKAYIWTLQAEGTFKMTHEQLLYKSPCTDNTSDENIPFNQQYNPCLQLDTSIPEDFPRSGNAIASEAFKGGKLKQLLLGKLYRESWGTAIENVPYLNLDTLHGGLTPKSKGGGGQTISLKFKAKDGQQFAFRLFEKQPNKKVDKELRNTIILDIAEDVTAQQHPYASLAVAYFMDVLGLPHSQPQIYLMPDHPRLGAYREEFAGTYGMWEVKPKKKKKDRKGFRDADEVDTTFKMYEEMMSNHHTEFDTETFVLARLFDMWISDWDRHQDNWKWLGYENEEGALSYTPFPKDRDKAFNLYQGVYQLMDWEMLDSYQARFRKSYRGVKSLNNKARNLDRILANEFTYEDWMRVVTKFEKLMTDEVIRAGLQQFPGETYEHSGPEIERLLKIRRVTLRDAATELYAHLSKEVTVIGTNKREMFEINRLKDGQVALQVFGVNKKRKKEKLLYQRTFQPSETKAINLYGLGKKDEFRISGTAKSSIKVRVIGGKGKDIIIDESKVSGLTHETKIYDFNHKDSLQMGTEAKLVNQNREIFFEARSIHNDNSFLFLPSASYNIDDGFGIGLSFNRTVQKFGKPDFGIKYNVSVQASTNSNYSLNLGATFRETVKKWDLWLNVLAAHPYNLHRFYYGLSNEPKLDEEEFETGYYRNETTVLGGKIGLRRRFWKKSQVLVSSKYEYLSVEEDPERELDPSIYRDLNPEGLGKSNFLGADIDVNIDLRDDTNFPTRGAQFKMKSYSFFNMRGESEFGGRTNIEALFYYTVGVKTPLTLGLRFGQMTSYGQVPFYYKSYLGQQSNLRGFRRNRYGGDSATYINTDLRLHLGTVWTRVLPLRFGLYGLFDSGRVYVEGESSDKWHYSFGGGAYLIPYADSFNLNFFLAQPDEGVALFNFRIGFFLR
ncbi:MAG: hypothetical protein ACI85O_003201 [Saprospiraceae bacterium]|jgi:hypothetical protein